MNARSLLLPAGVFGAVLLTGCPRPIEEAILPPTPARIVHFTASTTEAAPRQAVTLSWSVEAATSLSLQQLGAGPVAISGSEGQVEVTLGEQDAVFALVAQGEGGTDSRVLRVSVGAAEPLLVLAAMPARIAAGDGAVLAFSGPAGAELVDGSGAVLHSNVEAASGALSVSPLFDATYTLRAGEAQAQAQVAVAPGILEVRASVVEPGRVRLSWKAGGASALTVEGQGRGELFSTGSREAIAEGSFDDVLPEGLSADGLLSYTLKVSDGQAVASRQLTARAGGTPAIDSFTAPEYALEGGQFPLRWETRGAVRAEVWLGATQLFEATAPAQVSSGSFFPHTPQAPATYELRVFDTAGNKAVAQASTQPVGPVSLVRFDADTAAIATGGDPVRLEWEVTAARRVRILAKGRHQVHEVEGPGAEVGSVVVYPNEASVEYVLTAENTVGHSATASKVVTVGAPSGVQTWPEKLPTAYGAPLPEAQIASTAVANVVGYAGFPNVEKNLPGEGFVDIRAFGISAGFETTADTNYKSVVLPEPFTGVLFGRRLADYGRVHVSINGWLALSTTTYGNSGQDSGKFGLPNKQLEDLAMAPFFDDLRMTPEGAVHLAWVGVGNGRRLVVQYSELMLEGVPDSRLTFQAQVFASGKVVFAYQKLQGVAEARPSVGVQDYTSSVAVLAPDAPRAGDTYTFFGPTQTPAPYPVVTTGYFGRMMLADGGFLEFDGKPPALAKSLVYVSEVSPAAAPNVVGGEWIELTSASATEAVNLRGFTLDFGGGQRHTITADLVVPAGGQVLLAQTADGGDGLAVDYAYGPELALGDAIGRFALASGALDYATFEWTAGQVTPGSSLRFEPKQPAPWVYNYSSTGMVCPGATAYGTYGQLGTPKLPDSGCFPYALAASGGTAFEPLRASGEKLIVTQPRGQIFEVGLPFPVRVGYRLSSRLYVSSNGFLTLEQLTCVPTTSGCFSSNPTSPNPGSEPRGTVGVFWDALDYAKAPTGGIFWEARDPDGVAGNGDESVLVSWENVALYNSSSTFTSDLSFQAKLSAQGDVELRYGPMTATTATLAKGSSATAWIEDPTGNGALKVNVNSSSPGIAPNSVRLLSWEP